MMRPRSLANVTAAAVLSLSVASTAAGGAPERPEACIEDAMIVFDASGSMSGNEKLGFATNLKPMPNAAARIMEEVNGLIPAGKTPLTDAVAQATDILDFRHKPGVVVVLTDGEETCGRSACALGKQLRKSAAELTCMSSPSAPATSPGPGSKVS
jgi:Ca-activated chloride channel homolog